MPVVGVVLGSRVALMSQVPGNPWVPPVHPFIMASNHLAPGLPRPQPPAHPEGPAQGPEKMDVIFIQRKSVGGDKKELKIAGMPNVWTLISKEFQDLFWGNSNEWHIVIVSCVCVYKYDFCLQLMFSL